MRPPSNCSASLTPKRSGASCPCSSSPTATRPARKPAPSCARRWRTATRGSSSARRRPAPVRARANGPSSRCTTAKDARWATRRWSRSAILRPTATRSPGKQRGTGSGTGTWGQTISGCRIRGARSWDRRARARRPRNGSIASIPRIGRRCSRRSSRISPDAPRDSRASIASGTRTAAGAGCSRAARRAATEKEKRFDSPAR